MPKTDTTISQFKQALLLPSRLPLFTGFLAVYFPNEWVFLRLSILQKYFSFYVCTVYYVRKYLIVKIIYSEKAAKFCEIFPFLLTACTVVKSKGKISQNFVAFSEYMNFTEYLSFIQYCKLFSPIKKYSTLGSFFS